MIDGNWLKVVAAGDLADTGLAHRFELLVGGQSKPAFVFKYQGQIYAYLNRCPHQGKQLDSIRGQVFDDEGEYLVCSTHGAFFQPSSGNCIDWPCSGKALTPLNVMIENKWVYCKAQDARQESTLAS